MVFLCHGADISKARTKQKGFETLQMEEIELKSRKKTDFDDLVFEEGYCLTPLELYFTRKMSLLPEFVFPSSPPAVCPVKKILSEESTDTP